MTSGIPLRAITTFPAGVLLAFSILPGCGTFPGQQSAAETPAPGWVVLFDGGTTEHWRGFRQPTFPAEGWRVDGDALTPLVEGEVVDLITRRAYRNFELEFEWKVAPQGNSGLFFLVSEGYPQVWYSGPEIQLVDDLNHPDGEDPKTSAGSIYGLVAPGEKTLRPPGEYNQARLRVFDGQVQHWLNGRKILDFDLNSEEFRRRVEASKFQEMPGFGIQPSGHVALQHAGVSPLRAPVWFRKLRIRELADGGGRNPG